MSPWAGVGEVDGWPTVRSSDHRTLLAGHRGGDDDLDEEDSGTPLAVVILMVLPLNDQVQKICRKHRPILRSNTYWEKA